MTLRPSGGVTAAAEFEVDESPRLRVGPRELLVKSELGFKAAHREVIEQGETYVLREESEAYRSNFAGKNEMLRSENARFWNENLDATET